MSLTYSMVLRVVLNSGERIVVRDVLTVVSFPNEDVREPRLTVQHIENQPGESWLLKDIRSFSLMRA